MHKECRCILSRARPQGASGVARMVPAFLSRMLLAAAAIATVVASSTAAVAAAELPVVKACGHHDYPPWNWREGQQIVGACADAAKRAIVLALSADAAHDARERSLRAGFSAHLTKPVVFDELRAALRQPPVPAQ